MIPKKYSESIWILTVNIFVLGIQLINVLFVKEDIKLKILVFLFGLVFVILPILIYEITNIKKHNYLVETGKRITTHVLTDSIKITFLGRNQGAFGYLESTYTIDGQTYLFKGEFSCNINEFYRIKEHLIENPSVDVITDDTYKSGSMLIDQVAYSAGVPFGNDECSPYFNYIIYVANAVLLIINIVQDYV